jgi:WD40 repeat protein
LAAAAINNLNIDQERSVLLALHAVSVTYSADKTVTTKAVEALYLAMHSLRERLILRGHTERVHDVAFSPDGTRLATGSQDGTARVWDAASGRELLTLSEHTSLSWIRELNSIAFSPNGTCLATAGNDGTVQLYPLPAEFYVLPAKINIEALMALARTRVTRSLTPEECQKHLHDEQCPPTP